MSPLVLGIDYGGTSTKLLLAERGTRTPEHVDRTTVPTPRGDHPVDGLVAEVEAFLGGRGLSSGAITVAGIVDEAGVVSTSANLPWIEGTAIGDVVAARLGVPVSPVHDGRAAALGEALLGAGRGRDDLYVVTLGTGIAGAHVVRGEVRQGAHGAAGEIGHVSQDDAGELCTCGQRGCLETLVGGTHLARRWRDALAVDGRADPSATARDLVSAARVGDPVADRLLGAATTALARGLLAVVATVDPGCLVVGGGLGQAHDMIVDPVRRELHARATFHHVPPVLPAELGPWAGAWGAVLGAPAADTRAAEPELSSLDRLVPIDRT